MRITETTLAVQTFNSILQGWELTDITDNKEEAVRIMKAYKVPARVISIKQDIEIDRNTKQQF